MKSLSSGRKLAFVALAAVACLQVSCSTAPRSAKQPRLSIRLAGDDWFLKSLVATGMMSAYERNTGVHIEALNRNDQTIMADLDRGPAAADTAYDLVVMRHRFIGALVQKKQIQPIDGLLADPSLHDVNFQPAAQLFPQWWRELSWYGDRIYGYPYTGLTAFLCYRNDLLQDPENQRNFKARYHRELTAPANWKEYAQVADFFTRPDQHFYGTYISGKRGLALWYEWLNFVYSFGGNVLDTQHGWEYGDIVVNSPENIAATRQYVSLIAQSPPDTLNYGWNEAQAALQQGHAFMGLLWSDQAYLLEDGATSPVAGKIGYRLVPTNRSQPASQLEGLTYLIPTESLHPREAYRFLEWAMSSQVQVQQALKGGSSIRRSTYADTAVKRQPYAAAFLESIPLAMPKPTIPEASRMTEAAETRLADIVAGKETAQSGLDKLALDLQQILGNKGRLRYPVHRTS